MGVTTENREAYRLLRVEGFLDNRTPESLALADAVDRMIAERDERPVVLDLGGVYYMNSAMIGRLVEWHMALGRAGGRIALLAPAGSIRAVLEMTGLSHLLPIAECEAELPAVLEKAAPALPPEGTVDARAVTDEIERSMTSGRAPAEDRGSQIGRLLGG
jgi:anti-anti-sigma factor